MPDDQFKVPEAVLEAFQTIGWRDGQPSEASLVAALDAYDELLKGREAIEAATRQHMMFALGRIGSDRDSGERIAIQSAIDSVWDSG